MNSRTLGLSALLVSVVLLVATAADWTVMTSRDGLADDLVVIERTLSNSGADLAGGLLLVALLGMVTAGLLVRWPRTGLALLVLGGAGLVLTAQGWPAEGRVTAAPFVAVGCLLAYLALAFLTHATARRSVRAYTSSNGQDRGSRYTVEAVRSDTTDDEEWDLATAGDPDPADPATPSEDER